MLFEPDEPTVRGWLARPVAAETADTAWPTERPESVSTAAVDGAGAVREALSRDGAVVVGLPATLDDHALTVATWNLLTLLGRPTPQYDTGELVYTVEVRPSAEGASHYSASASSGNLHTDGSLLDRAPDTAVLLCLSPADEGGETVLVPSDAVRAHLELVAPEGWAELTRPQPFSAEDDTTVRQHESVVTVGDDRTQMRYLRRYLDRGLELGGVAPSAELVRALDAIDTYALDESHQEPHGLTRGQVLLWVNTAYLHGRRAFREEGSARRLVRMYAVDRQPVSAAV